MHNRIYPIAAAVAAPVNKYAGLRMEIAAYKAAVQLRKREQLATAAAAAAKTRQKPQQKPPRLRKEPNAFASTFQGLIKEYCTYWTYIFKTFMSNIKKDFIPIICCLRAEI
jgi:hypothetical protein